MRERSCIDCATKLPPQSKGKPRLRCDECGAERQRQQNAAWYEANRIDDGWKLQRALMARHWRAQNQQHIRAYKREYLLRKRADA